MGWEDRDYCRKPRPVTWVDAYTETTSTNDYPSPVDSSSTRPAACSSDSVPQVSDLSSLWRVLCAWADRWLLFPFRLVRMAVSPQRSQHARSAEVDAVLAKVSKLGLTSLTPEERLILDKATQRMNQ